MKTILFCNTRVPNCGVYQYGRNLASILEESDKYNFVYTEPEHEGAMCEQVRQHDAKAIFYNWHPGQGGWMASAPFNVYRSVKNVLVFHDWKGETSKFDAVLLSDPTMKDHDNWWSIPRPLPHWAGLDYKVGGNIPTIGVHGFGGASAEHVMARVMAEFEHAFVRAHLPFAQYGDQNGAAALNMARHLLKMATAKPTIVVEVSHHFMEQRELLAWLSGNHLNCYIRDTAIKWEGISSALDAALAVRRPIAINRCQGFRHMFNCQPSILLENRSLREILTTGTAPLALVYQENSHDKLIARVEKILEHINV